MATIPFSQVLAVFTGDPADRSVEAHVEMLRRLLAGATFRELRLPASTTPTRALRRVRDEVASVRADLVVVGALDSTHGSRALAGRLVDTAPCSVWMTPSDAPATLSRTLVPIDLSDHSADALLAAARLLTAAGGGRSHAVHVRTGPVLLTFEEADTAGKARAQDALTNLVARVDVGNVDVDARIVESANVARAIVRAAAEHAVDLIVMTTRGRSRAAALLLPSETRKVTDTSPVPVLALKHPGAPLGLAGAWRDPRVRARGWRFS